MFFKTEIHLNVLRFVSSFLDKNRSFLNLSKCFRVPTTTVWGHNGSSSVLVSMSCPSVCRYMYVRPIA